MRPTDSEDSRAFLQRRTSLFLLILGSAGAAFFFFRVIARATAGDAGDLLKLNMASHFVGMGVMLAGGFFLRFGNPSERRIRAVETTGVLSTCVAYGVMTLSMPQAFRPDMTLLLIFTMLIVARSVLIPSTWQRTAGLSVGLGVTLVAATLTAYDPMEPAVAAMFAEFPSDFQASVSVGIMLYALMWWLGLAGLASATSAVIYGLRREMSQAKRLGQYALIRKLGEGGMGVVYEARHAMLRRPTAVKLLLPERVGEESLARFEREVRATATLSHPNTITVFDYGRTPEGVFYYAMEYLKGGTLGDVVKLDGAMSPKRAVHILHQVAGALSEAHDAGLVHRDVKPDNILLTQTGWRTDLAKVLDFGLVKEVTNGGGVTRDERIVGTPQYMAPEIIRGAAEPDPRSDLYALGGVAYYLLTGRNVFEGESVVAVCAMHLTESPTPPSQRVDGVSEELEQLILACLAKQPADRPDSAREVQQWLEVLPEYGTWTDDEARRWWQQLGPDLQASRDGSTPSRVDTLTIDIGSRR